MKKIKKAAMHRTKGSGDVSALGKAVAIDVDAGNKEKTLVHAIDSLPFVL